MTKYAVIWPKMSILHLILGDLDLDYFCASGGHITNDVDLDDFHYDQLCASGGHMNNIWWNMVNKKNGDATGNTALVRFMMMMMMIMIITTTTTTTTTTTIIIIMVIIRIRWWWWWWWWWWLISTVPTDSHRTHVRFNRRYMSLSRFSVTDVIKIVPKVRINSHTSNRNWIYM